MTTDPFSDCPACDRMGRDDQGRALLCEAHRDRNLRAIALIRAQHAGDPRWSRSQTESDPLSPEGKV